MSKTVDLSMAEKKKIVLENEKKSSEELALMISDTPELVEIIRDVAWKGLDQEEKKREKIREKGPRRGPKKYSVDWSDPTYERFLHINRKQGKTYKELQEDFLKAFGVAYSETTIREHCPDSSVYGRKKTCGKFLDKENYNE